MSSKELKNLVSWAVKSGLAKMPVEMPIEPKSAKRRMGKKPRRRLLDPLFVQSINEERWLRTQ
jgi:hypothetical protein